MELTHENYFSLEADREYMSVHQFKAWTTCAEKEAARQRGDYVPGQVDAFVFGHYVDCALTTPDEFEAFCAENAGVILNRKGEKYSDYRIADGMIARVQGDPDAVELLAGDCQAIVTGEIDGVQWKGAVDCLKLDCGIFTDLKTTRDFSPTWEAVVTEGFSRNVRVPWYGRYWAQMAVYRSLIEQQFGVVCEPVILGVSKHTRKDEAGETRPSPGLVAVRFNDADCLDQEIALIRADLPQVMAWKTGDAIPPACGNVDACDWCRERGKLKIWPAQRVYVG